MGLDTHFGRTYKVGMFKGGLLGVLFEIGYGTPLLGWSVRSHSTRYYLVTIKFGDIRPHKITHRCLFVLFCVSIECVTPS